MMMMQNFHSSPPPLRHLNPPPSNRCFRPNNILPPDLSDVQPYGMITSEHVGQMTNMVRSMNDCRSNLQSPQMNQHPSNPCRIAAIPRDLMPPLWPSHAPQMDPVGQQRFLDSFNRYQSSRQYQRQHGQLPAQLLQPQQHQLYQQQQKQYEQSYQVFRNNMASPQMGHSTTRFPAYSSISPIEGTQDNGACPSLVHAYSETYRSPTTNIQPENNNRLSHPKFGQETSSETFAQVITVDGVEYPLRRTEESVPLDDHQVPASVSIGASQTNVSSKTCIVCRQTFFSEHHVCSECARKLKEYELLKKQRQSFPTLLIGDLPPPTEPSPLSSMPSLSSTAPLTTSTTLSSTPLSMTVISSPSSTSHSLPLSSSCPFSSASTSPSLSSVSSSPSFTCVSVTSSYTVSSSSASSISPSFSATSSCSSSSSSLFICSLSSSSVPSSSSFQSVFTSSAISPLSIASISSSSSIPGSYSSSCSSDALSSSSTSSIPSYTSSLSSPTSSPPCLSPISVSISSFYSLNPSSCPNSTFSLPSTSSSHIHSSISSSSSSTSISDSEKGTKVDPERFLRSYDEGLEASFLAFVNESSSKSCATTLTSSSKPCLKRKSPVSIFEETDYDITSNEPFKNLKINKERLEALRRRISRTLVVK